MFSFLSFRRLAVAFAVASAATAAVAHPALVSSTPAEQSAGPAPSTIELHFSETLSTQFSAASLTMTAMSGMADHGPMKMPVGVAPGTDGKTMVLTPARPLAAGTYRVDWRAVSSDTHPVKGQITFEVK